MIEHETGYFASLWMMASQAHVLASQDAHRVANHALRAAEGRSMPCAKDLQPCPVKATKTGQKPSRESGSAWVH